MLGASFGKTLHRSQWQKEGGGYKVLKGFSVPRLGNKFHALSLVNNRRHSNSSPDRRECKTYRIVSNMVQQYQKTKIQSNVVVGLFFAVHVRLFQSLHWLLSQLINVFIS